MELIITLNQGEFRLEIRQKSRVVDPAPFEGCASRKNQNLTALKRCGVDFETAKYYHDISDVLISSLDKLLLRANIDIKSLKGYKIEGDMGASSTSYKIVSAFVEGLKI